MRVSFRAALLCAAGVLLVISGCGQSNFSYEVSTQVMPEVATLPAADGAISPVVAYQDPNGVRTDFMADEVVISPKSQAELEQFLSEYGGTILGDNSVPEPPDILRGKVNFRKEDSLPTSYTVRVTIFPDVSNLPRDAARRGVEGKYLFSSEEAVKLMALTSYENARGLKIHPNSLLSQR